MQKPSEISLGRRVTFWLLAWAAATVATLFPLPLAVFWLWAFPSGLYGFFNWSTGNGIGDLVAGWLLYAGISVAGLTRRKRLPFYFVFTLLVITLVFNVIGCNQGFHDMERCNKRNALCLSVFTIFGAASFGLEDRASIGDWQPCHRRMVQDCGGSRREEALKFSATGTKGGNGKKPEPPQVGCYADQQIAAHAACGAWRMVW
jgi:hypothetical protein